MLLVCELVDDVVVEVDVFVVVEVVAVAVEVEVQLMPQKTGQWWRVNVPSVLFS